MTTSYNTPCHSCGKCCYAEIPVNLLDIYRIAQSMHLLPEMAFKATVSREQLGSSGLYRVRKKKNGSCIYLDECSRCAIHEFKPGVCEIYHCTPLSKKAVNDSAYSQSRRQLLWESAISNEITRAYIRQCHLDWCDTLYQQAIAQITRHMVVSPAQKLSLALDDNGCVVGDVHDCATCDSRGRMAQETPVTLVDVERIARELRLGVAQVFDRFLDSRASLITGGLQLKRSGKCVFFKEDTHCQISAFRPAHCIFTPCAKRMQTPELYDCLFIGAGTVEEQFAHQIALGITREYVTRFGAQYHASGFKAYLCRVHGLRSSSSQFEAFSAKIQAHRVPAL
ncbi:MAG: YkgJ family cysteine cluster protein [Deltaproteobacteria bacterium]|nr:YkgJ family cysteine cluster protein [Deltaproteobacteria bacterium]